MIHHNTPRVCSHVVVVIDAIINHLVIYSATVDFVRLMTQNIITLHHHFSHHVATLLILTFFFLFFLVFHSFFSNFCLSRLFTPFPYPFALSFSLVVAHSLFIFYYLFLSPLFLVLCSLPIFPTIIDQTLLLASTSLYGHDFNQELHCMNYCVYTKL